MLDGIGAKSKPSLLETLERNAIKSREIFGGMRSTAWEEATV
jgi:hypothetical protein